MAEAQRRPGGARISMPAPTPNPVMTEEEIMEYLDVLTRTAEANEILIRHLDDPEHKELLARDNVVLNDIRARIWRQFVPVFVDVLN